MDPSDATCQQTERAAFQGGPLRLACVSYCSTLGVSNHCSANRKASLPLFSGDPTRVRIEFSPVSDQQQQQKSGGFGSCAVLAPQEPDRSSKVTGVSKPPPQKLKGEKKKSNASDWLGVLRYFVRWFR